VSLHLQMHYVPRGKEEYIYIYIYIYIYKHTHIHSNILYARSAGMYGLYSLGSVCQCRLLYEIDASQVDFCMHFKCMHVLVGRRPWEPTHTHARTHTHTHTHVYVYI
jgi:hypothetical protein